MEQAFNVLNVISTINQVITKWIVNGVETIFHNDQLKNIIQKLK